MKPSYYFKITFFPLTAGIFAYMMVSGLFDVYDNIVTIEKVLLRSAVVAVVSGLILGVLNMIFKWNLPGKKNK